MEDIIDHKKVITETEDEVKLYKRASQRATFKIHAAIFILINLFLWVIWYFLFKGETDASANKVTSAVLFVTIAWFIILTGHYLFVFKWNKSLVDKELMRLKKENKKKEEELERMRQEAENNTDNQDNSIE